MRNIYEEAVKRMPPEYIDNHETDLYLKVTDISRELVKEYDFKSNVTTFYSATPPYGLWYDIPFAFTPAWDERLNY